jgi:hypothetical protein
MWAMITKLTHLKPHAQGLGASKSTEPFQIADRVTSKLLELSEMDVRRQDFGKDWYELTQEYEKRVEREPVKYRFRRPIFMPQMRGVSPESTVLVSRVLESLSTQVCEVHSYPETCDKKSRTAMGIE